MSAPPRSWLFVPGDSERKLAKGGESGADALILDLEDSVAAGRSPLARGMVLRIPRRAWPAGRSSGCASTRWMARGWSMPPPWCARPPTGWWCRRSSGPAELLRVSHWLDALEAREGLPPGGIRLLAVATETAAAVLGLSRLRAHRRCRGCTG